MNEIKNAATIILIRRMGKSYFVLMGKRNSTAAFMPSKYVFPGGAWDNLDRNVPIVKKIHSRQEKLLRLETNFAESTYLGITAIRELWEETGLRLSSAGKFNSFPSNWKDFFSDGQGPDLSNLNFFFRAVTPPGRTRRFDARFFFCSAQHIYDDLDDFTNASGELRMLHWVEISEAKHLDLPRITRLVIKHLIAEIKSDFVYSSVPFYFSGADGLSKKNLEC